jgi:hypothetical protein
LNPATNNLSSPFNRRGEGDASGELPKFPHLHTTLQKVKPSQHYCTINIRITILDVKLSPALPITQIRAN